MNTARVLNSVVSLIGLVIALSVVICAESEADDVVDDGGGGAVSPIEYPYLVSEIGDGTPTSHRMTIIQTEADFRVSIEFYEVDVSADLRDLNFAGYVSAEGEWSELTTNLQRLNEMTDYVAMTFGGEEYRYDQLTHFEGIGRVDLYRAHYYNGTDETTVPGVLEPRQDGRYMKVGQTDVNQTDSDLVNGFDTWVAEYVEDSVTGGRAGYTLKQTLNAADLDWERTIYFFEWDPVNNGWIQRIVIKTGTTPLLAPDPGDMGA